MANTKMHFHNLYPDTPLELRDVLRWKLGLGPKEVPPVILPETREALAVAAGLAKKRTAELTEVPAAERVRLTWIGHATFLLQHYGRNILTDPIFGDCQPVPIGRLRRALPPGIALRDMPRIDDVVISHSHYDHLDKPAIKALGAGVHYWVPMGLGEWFRKRGMERCTEMGWWQSAELGGGITLHSVPAQHSSGRTGRDRDETLWCGWVLKSATRTVYFAGDTGYSPVFREIGARFGGVDLAILPIGAYQPRWLMKVVHMNPAEAVQAHLDVEARTSVGCHFGTFRLADEPLEEPPALLAQELAARQIDPQRFLALANGESIDI